MTAGASMRHAAPTPWSDAEREQLRRMHANGLSMSQMAQLLGRTKDSVSRQMRNLELAKNERAVPTVKTADHDWLLVAVANGERGYYCRRCRMAVAHMGLAVGPCLSPNTHPKTARPHAPRSTLPMLPSLMMDD